MAIKIQQHSNLDFKINTKTLVEKVADECVEDIQKYAKQVGIGGHEYIQGWTYLMDEGKAVVHNKKHYRLTHLLEYGHIIRNQFGTYGKTDPRPHIRNAYKDAIKNLKKHKDDVKIVKK